VGNYGLALLADGHLRFITYDADFPFGFSNFRFVDSSATIPLGTFHHVAVTVDTNADEVRFYIDGILDSVRPWTANLYANNAPLTIGRGEDTYYFHGLIDEVT